MKTCVITRKQRKPGDLFQEITGRSVTEFAGVRDVERAVEEKLGHKLEFKYFDSNVVPRRGDVFPHSNVDMEQVNAEIDKRLQKV